MKARIAREQGKTKVRMTRPRLVDEWIIRTADGRPTKLIEKKLAKTKAGRELTAITAKRSKNRHPRCP